MGKVDFDKKSKVTNLCPWQVSWGKTLSTGDTTIKAGASVWVLNSELDAQVSERNVYLCGEDSMGAHARVKVLNDDLREHFGFLTRENGKITKEQFLLTEDICKKIFEYKTQSTFEKHLESDVVATHEKHFIMEYAAKNKINDYNKIKKLEEHTGISFSVYSEKYTDE